MPNDHYVQEALFKHWSAENETGAFSNKVTFFNFATKSFDRVHTSKLFARVGLNPPEREARLNRLVEAPLAKFRDAQVKRLLRTEAPPRKPLNDERTMNAIGLVLAIQSARASDALGVKNRRLTLADLLSLPDDMLSAVAFNFRSTLTFATLRMESDALYPEIGYFAFPILRQSQAPTIAYAIPLTPWLLLTAQPKAKHVPLDRSVVEYIPEFSVGIQTSPRVVILAERVAQTEAPELARALLKAREKSVNVLKELHALEQLAELGSTGLTRPR